MLMVFFLSCFILLDSLAVFGCLTVTSSTPTFKCDLPNYGFVIWWVSSPRFALLSQMSTRFLRPNARHSLHLVWTHRWSHYTFTLHLASSRLRMFGRHRKLSHIYTIDGNLSCLIHHRDIQKGHFRCVIQNMLGTRKVTSASCYVLLLFLLLHKQQIIIMYCSLTQYHSFFRCCTIMNHFGGLTCSSFFLFGKCGPLRVLSRVHEAGGHERMPRR